MPANQVRGGEEVGGEGRGRRALKNKTVEGIRGTF